MNNFWTILIIIFTPLMCYAECEQDATVVAQSFMNEYIEYLNNMWANKVTMEADQWVRQNKRTTSDFKSSYKIIVEKAKEEEPILGLNSDPILDAQDWPDKGIMLDHCDNNFVTLKGKDWERFKVVVKVVKAKRGWMVDGSGIVNIPQNKQAAR